MFRLISTKKAVFWNSLLKKTSFRYPPNEARSTDPGERSEQWWVSAPKNLGHCPSFAQISHLNFENRARGFFMVRIIT